MTKFLKVSKVSNFKEKEGDAERMNIIVGRTVFYRFGGMECERLERLAGKERKRFDIMGVMK